MERAPVTTIGATHGSPVPPAAGTSPHARTADEVTAALHVRPDQGLSDAEATRRRVVHGPNELRAIPPRRAIVVLVDQFRSLIMALLAAAAGLAVATGDALEAVAIAVVIALNVAIGFFSELRAVRSMEALRGLGAARATVRRGGRARSVPAADLVPGDVVLVEGGDVVSADLRLIECSRLQADESALTGESLPVDKHPDTLPADTPLHARANLLFKGTAIPRGTAVGVVVASGMRTELGRISELIESMEGEGLTPLERRIAGLGRRLVVVVIALAVVIAAIGLARGQDLTLVAKTAIALAVAAIPEGLPVVATLALARGMLRMARRNALVNRLAAVETLGSTTVICTDKTGTLTENRMAVTAVVTPTAELAGDDIGRDEAARDALALAALCTDAELSGGEAVGDPMEVAILRAADAAGVDRAGDRGRRPRLRSVAFDPERRMMATVHADEGGVRVVVKGAPEAVLAAGAAPTERTARWQRENSRLAEAGLRVLAVAARREPDVDPRGDAEVAAIDPYVDLEVVALLGFLDPPRVDVRPAIDACRGAGIRVVVLTGDQARTAMHVARRIGLEVEGEATAADLAHLVADPATPATDDDDDDDGAGAGAARRAETRVTARDPGGDEAAREERVLSSTVLARVSPHEKLALVRLYQRRGEVVAMTGDGVNDAPALKQADIGIAMGKRGTQVAREAADVILRDDAFGTIAAAVEEGRVIFHNIRTFVRYLISCNLSELFAILVANVIGLGTPLLPMQILFLNLVTDVFPALALAMNEGHPGVMRRPPRDPREPLLTPAHWRRCIADGLLIAGAVLGAMLAAEHVLGLDGPAAVTVSFLTLALAQLAHVFTMRPRDARLRTDPVVGNPLVYAAIALCVVLLAIALWVPPIAAALHAPDPGAAGLALAVGASLAPFAVLELTRVVRPRAH